VGPVTVSYLDADVLRAADYRIELTLWPAGRLVLSQLGRRFDAFAQELRAARDQARRERERMFWEQQLRPALLSAIAEKAKQQKTITRSLITAVLETLTMRDDDLTTWCGPTAKLPADRFAAALLMALALREQFSQDRLSSFAKGLRVNVPALCKRLKADKPDEPAS